MTEPFAVRRVFTDGGSHIEPPHNADWDNYRSLRWRAAVTNHDCPGLKVVVHQDGNSYNVVTSWCSAAPFDFRSAWTYINGLTAGYMTRKAVIE